MAWYNDGNWDGLRNSELAFVLRDLCFGINQRQEFLNETKTEWIIGNGSEKPDPVYTDFDGLKISGDAAGLVTNINRARAAIEDLLPIQNNAISRSVFVANSSPYDINWTLSSLLGAGSYGTSWLGFEKRQDARVYLQLQEALVGIPIL